MQLNLREHRPLLAILAYGIRGKIVFRDAELLDTDLNLVNFPNDPRNYVYDALYYVAGAVSPRKVPPEALPLPQWEGAQVRCLVCDGSILIPPGYVRAVESDTVLPCSTCTEWRVHVRPIPPN